MTTITCQVDINMLYNRSTHDPACLIDMPWGKFVLAPVNEFDIAATRGNAFRDNRCQETQYPLAVPTDRF